MRDDQYVNIDEREVVDSIRDAVVAERKAFMSELKRRRDNDCFCVGEDTPCMVCMELARLEGFIKARGV